jgi:hypothetical protein
MLHLARSFCLRSVSHRALSLGGGPDVYPTLMRSIFMAGRTLGLIRLSKP